jgi:hypothetical protein
VSTLLPSTDLSRLLVVSPHFDDAVLSCATQQPSPSS